MTILAFTLLVYFIIQLAKPDSLTSTMLNKVGELYNESEENKDKDKELSTTKAITASLCLIFIAFPLLFIKIITTFSLLFLTFVGLKNDNLFYPSLVMIILFSINVIIASIKGVKKKNKKKNEDKLELTKTRRTFKGWVILIIDIVYVFWFLYVI